MKNIFMVSAVFGFIVYNGLNQTKPVMTPTNMVECDQSSNISKTNLIDSHKNSFFLYWSDKASKHCPGPGFPRIVVEHPRIKYWVQVVKSNVPYEYLNGHTDGWMGRIASDDGDMIWLDIPKEHKKRKYPFYTSYPQTIFHDNPSWGYLPEKSELKKLVWRAYLYGFPTSNITEKPWVKLQWGFDLVAGENRSIAVKPKSTDIKMLKKFLSEYIRVH